MGLTGPGMLSRRDFINGTIGAGVALAAQGARTAKAQMNTRKRTIVDAQVHLWKAKSGDTVRFPDASNSNMDGTIFPRARAEFCCVGRNSPDRLRCESRWKETRRG